MKSIQRYTLDMGLAYGASVPSDKGQFIKYEDLEELLKNAYLEGCEDQEKEMWEYSETKQKLN